MIDISIVVVSWNAKRHVQHCLTSLEQAVGELTNETIVVDNASSDATPDMVMHEFPRVSLVRNAENLGFAKGNNVGIRRAQGRYLCLINSDVTVSPTCIRTLVDFMDRNPRVGIAGPAMVCPNGRVGASCMRRPSLAVSLVHALGFTSVLPGFSLHLPVSRDGREAAVDVLSGWFWIVRRSALDEVGLLDERYFMYGEDIDWCHRFQDAGWGVVYVPGAQAVHYGGGSSAAAPVRFYVDMHRANVQYWTQYHSSVSVLTYQAILFLHHLLRVIGYGAVYMVNRSARVNVGFKIARSTGCLLWLLGWAEPHDATVA